MSELASTLWAKDALLLVKADVADSTLPPQEGQQSSDQRVIHRSFTARTRGYLEIIVEQINQTYEGACYDASAVMIRRMVETLIIECFEAHTIAVKIQGPSGDYLALSGLIDKAIEESDRNGAWHLSRNAKSALKTIKKSGDLSAHNPRYLAHRSDIDGIKDDFRIVVQELVSHSGIQRAK